MLFRQALFSRSSLWAFLDDCIFRVFCSLNWGPMCHHSSQVVQRLVDRQAEIVETCRFLIKRKEMTWLKRGSLGFWECLGTKKRKAIKINGNVTELPEISGTKKSFPLSLPTGLWYEAQFREEVKKKYDVSWRRFLNLEFFKLVWYHEFCANKGDLCNHP